MTDGSTRPSAVFDPGSTLAGTAHRQRHPERRPRDWDAFFAAAPADPPIEQGVESVRESAAECEIVCLTGRPERCRRDTRDWLAAHRLHKGRVHIRRGDDRRPARHTGLEIPRRLARDREIRVLCVRWAALLAGLRAAQGRAGRT